MSRRWENTAQTKVWLLVGTCLVIGLWAANTWLSNVELTTLQAWQSQVQIVFNNQPILFTFIYFIFFTAITATCLPGASILMLTCSGCMGLVGCSLISTLASASGALITMLFARYFFRDKVKQRWPEKLLKLDQGLASNEIPFLISLRLAPVIPFVPFNLLAGITHVKSWRFFWTSVIGMLPGTIIYVNAGFHLSSMNSVGDFFQPSIIFSLIALAAIPWVLQALFKHRKTTHQG